MKGAFEDKRDAAMKKLKKILKSAFDSETDMHDAFNLKRPPGTTGFEYLPGSMDVIFPVVAKVWFIF